MLPSHYCDASISELSVANLTHKASILLVEDNLILQQLHGSWLIQLGYKVTIVSSGEEALQHFIPDFDVILMDIDLPGISGIATSRRISSEYPGLKKPMIACTTHSALDMKADCMAVGMVDYLQKPLSLSRLSACLTAHLAYR